MTDEKMMAMFVLGHTALQKEMQPVHPMGSEEVAFGFKVWLAETKAAALRDAAQEMPFIVANNGGASTWLNKRADALAETGSQR